MQASPITWLLAGLFLLFGLPLVITEDPTWARRWAGMSTLCLGGFALSMVRDALRSGQIRLQHTVIRRYQHPRFFWSAVLLVMAAGLGVLCAALWFLFFKT